MKQGHVTSLVTTALLLCAFSDNLFPLIGYLLLRQDVVTGHDRMMEQFQHFVETITSLLYVLTSVGKIHIFLSKRWMRWSIPLSCLCVEYGEKGLEKRGR